MSEILLNYILTLIGVLKQNTERQIMKETCSLKQNYANHTNNIPMKAFKKIIKTYSRISTIKSLPEILDYS